MNKQKKILISIIAFFIILLSSYQVFAVNYLDGEIDISQSYLEYLELTDEEKENTIEPRMYDISKSNMTVRNPFKLARMLGSSIEQKYSLKSIIPENMVVRNQETTNICWAFANLATLESHLALQDYKNGITTPIVYNFSERHMDYATTREFLDGEINEFGFNRVAGDVAVSGVPIAYLTNGSGAIAEDEMEFSSNTDLIDISEIQNKNVITQVNDIITFPSYSATDDTTQIKQQMKEHIMNYGAITAEINAGTSAVYNSETAALYCDNSSKYKVNHSVSIVGWNDEYSLENFVEGNRPTNNGAWIAKNSYGENFGDEGYIYISYEDVNIYSKLTGIVNAQTEITYENIYQYDEFGGYLKYKSNGSPKIYLATEFDKKTAGTEYLTQVSIYTAETYTCKVYVNPNGTSKAIEDLQQIDLKTGETETIDAGYHTIEFLNPLKINGESFVVVLEIEGTQDSYVTVMSEVNYGEFYTSNPNAANHDYDNVTIADEKCFMAKEEEFQNNEWRVTSKLYETSNGKLPNLDTTIKAFTTSKILESIEITTAPTKTSYVEGQDFDSAGMIVKGNYANGDIIDITDYEILDGTDLALGQTSVTISYNGLTTTQTIEVVENVIESIEIKTPPTKTEYWAGDDFDAAGMEIEAIYTDGTRIPVTEYEIQNGQALKNDQTTVIIEYEGKTVIQEIAVQLNSVVKIEVVTAATKLTYVVGQNFDSTGMVVKATYANGAENEVTEYTIQDGNNLQVNQTVVTISYEGQITTQAITVIEKTVTGITIKEKPTKTEYIQNKEELDLIGGIIEISYNDDTTEEMLMTSSDITITGFNNSEAGTQTITIIYQDKTAQFEIEIEELPKPENSNFDNMQGNVTGIKAYYFTDKNQKEYTILNIELSNIIKATENEKMEYYYYLSSNPNEENISGWIKFDESEVIGDRLAFEINTLDISNYEELSGANNIYLYVKEVATRNGMKAEAVTSSLSLDVENINIEEYVDGEKKADVNSDAIIDSIPAGTEDNTKAPGTIPKAGNDILMICLTIAIIIIGKVSYKKYKDIEI